MAIIKQIPEYNAPYEVMLNLYPDQFIDEGGRAIDGNGNSLPMPKQHVSRGTKMSMGWWKINMDYFYTIGLAQYNHQFRKIRKNYELLKGRITSEDFYQDIPEVNDLASISNDIVDKLMKDVELPKYVVHYPILNPPINTMVGEMSKRPDVSRPKAMDNDSLSEEGQYYTDLYIHLITESAKGKIQKDLLAKGTDVSNMEEFQQKVDQLTEEKIKEYKVNYTSEAEIWSNAVINALKVEFNLKELFEEGFRDMLICNRQFYHIYENKTKTGFTVDCLNPKYVWWLTTPDKKYIRDAYAAGIIEVMELSEVLDKFDLPEEEIDHLRKYAMEAFFPYSRESNALKQNGGGEGINSIKYNTYDPLILQERMKMESMLNQESQDSMDGFIGNAAPNIGTFGNRFIVTTAYWKSKRKVGLLTYIDQTGEEVSDLVDDNYHDGDHPQEISIEWDWKNQWYKGLQIGNDIYHLSPLEILDYCPIIGVSHEIKNTISVSLVDLMKPLQTIYNVCWNQIYHLLEIEPGMVLIMNKRFIPLLKGADLNDSESIFMNKVKEEKIVWIDDSPDNLGAKSGFNQFSIQDWTVSKQIESRLQLALAVKNECWELIGISKQRQGTIQASETATATNTALTQSYAQTEPYFVQHEYITNQVLQAILDVAKYQAVHNNNSTVGFIDSEGGNVFCKMQDTLSLSNKDIKLFMTSRAEDQRILQKLQDLSGAMLQNGTPEYVVAQTYVTNSTRKLMKIYKDVSDMRDKMNQQKQDAEDKAQQMEEQKNQADQQFKEKQHQEDIQLKTYEIDTKANTELTGFKIKEAIEAAKLANHPVDYLGIHTQYQKDQQSIFDRDLAGLKLDLEKQKLQNDSQQNNVDNNLKQQKLDNEREQMKSKERIEKEKAKNKPKSTSK